RGAHAHNQVDLETDQLGREVGEAVGSSLGMPPLDGDVLAFQVPEVTKSLQECFNDEGRRIATRREHPYPGNLRRRLRTRSTRRRGTWVLRGDLKRRPHHLHRVLLEQRPDCCLVCAREALKEPFESCRVHGPEQYAGVRANVLEGMRHILWDEDERPGGCALDALTELEVELPAQDVEELILRSVDVQRWS